MAFKKWVLSALGTILRRFQSEAVTKTPATSAQPQGYENRHKEGSPNPAMADEDDSIQTWEVTEPYLNIHCELGEGPYYEQATNTFRFVDIKKKQVHTVSLDAGPSSLQTVQLDEPVTVTADIEGVDPQEKILIGVKYGIAVLDRKAGTYEYVSRFHDEAGGNARLRSNDGAVDPHGRFWLGTMTDFGLGDFQPEGILFRFDNGKTVAAVQRTGITIPNAIGWSPDYRTMYFTHSSARQILAWDYSPEDGALTNERLFYEHRGPGEPDGCRIDKDGNLWHAVYGEGRVIRISPQGKITGQVKLPTSHITCTEFVGTELFITCADDDEGEGLSKEYGGAVFRVDVGTTGLARHSFKMGG